MDEDVMCRYCFGGAEDGPLISPCACSGSQRYAHLSCLRRWQRMVLVSQPTHPAFQHKDVRHHKCNVCTTEFTCEPPTRHELMESFTGAEIAALISEGCVIGAHGHFSAELEEQLGRMPAMQQEMASYLHWIRGAYLITAVEVDDGSVTVPVRSRASLMALRAQLGEDLSITHQGSVHRLAARGGLAGVRQEDLGRAFGDLETPAEIVLVRDAAGNCGEDHVRAVNLTRHMVGGAPWRSRAEVDETWASVRRRYPGASKVELTHFKGGPCDSDSIVTCIVPGGSGKGWTIKSDLEEAITLAHSRAARRSEAQGNIASGQSVRLAGLVGAAHLNGEVGLTLRFAEDSGRWLLRLRNGEGKQVKPANLEPLEGGDGRVFVFWGDARWSRTQLLGEIARGHWGLCRANVTELTAQPSERRAGLEGRLVFAPVTEMTEDFMRNAQQQMVALRANAMGAWGERGEEEEENEP